MSIIFRGACIVGFISPTAVASFPLSVPPLILRHRRNYNISVNNTFPSMATDRKLKLRRKVEKTEMLEIETKNVVALRSTRKDNGNEREPTNIKKEREKVEDESGNKTDQKEEKKMKQEEPTAKDEDVALESEPKTGVSFPVKLADGKKLNAVGLRKKSMLGLGIKIYAFGIYADNAKLKDFLSAKIGKTTKEMLQMVIDSDVAMMVRLVIVFSGLTMSMVRKNFDESLGASIKKLTGGKNDELTKKIMGEASDDIKLTPGSVIEISRLPGYTLQTKVMDEVVSTVESELLCRAYMYLYLGEEPFDKEAKEKFGTSLLSLF